MRKLSFLLMFCTISGCVHTSVVPLAADTIEVTTSAAPACGATGAQNVAFHRAAVETLRAGYDRFIILGGNTQNSVGIIGYSPTVTNTYGSATAYGGPGYANVYGQSTSVTSGGSPIIAGSHDESIVVKMFHEGDPASENAVSARAYLGPNWQMVISASNPNTCTN